MFENHLKKYPFKNIRTLIPPKLIFEKVAMLEHLFPYYKISTGSRGGGQNGCPTSADFVVLKSDFENFSLEMDALTENKIFANKNPNETFFGGFQLQ